MITISNLTKKYGNKSALSNVSFNVKKGEILGFLGPNGAGKSTTMNIITGFISYTEGSVKVDGFDILENPIEVKKRIGYLPEIPPLYLDMTVLEYLNFVYDLKKVNADSKSEHIQHILNLVKIKDVENRKIGNLSKGYRQRVGLSCALIGSPDVLILDEPTVGLDPKQIIEIRNIIKELGKSKTIILSSHILSEISAVCDRVIIINNGKVIAEDTPSNLSSRLSGPNKMEITVSGSNKDAAQILSSFDKISNVICTLEEADKSTFKFDTKMEAEEKKRLFFAFADKGIAIIDQKETEVSLEDIFLKLTEKNEEGKNESDIL